MAVMTGLVIATVFAVYRHWFPAGERLNRMAWEASFAERGVPLPAEGPREGYWGKQLGDKVRDPELGWYEAETHIPGRVDVDERGLQHYRPPGAAADRHLLIVGGSVAFGAYASSIETTYFARLAQLLDARGLPVRITVLAAGGWFSRNERSALAAYLPELRPDAVLLIDGLNDLTRFRRRNLAERAQGYLATLPQMAELARGSGAPLWVCLQPFLPRKLVHSELEARVLSLSVDPRGAKDPFMGEPPLRESFAGLERGVQALADAGRVAKLECSGALDGETATTFTDLWHFSDPGHERLARCLADEIEPLLRNLDRRGGGRTGADFRNGFRLNLPAGE